MRRFRSAETGRSADSGSGAAIFPHSAPISLNASPGTGTRASASLLATTVPRVVMSCRCMHHAIAYLTYLHTSCIYTGISLHGDEE